MLLRFALLLGVVLSPSVIPGAFATSTAGTRPSALHHQLVILALLKPIQLNDTKNAFIGIADLLGHTQALLFVSVPIVDKPGNMACRGDLGSAAANTWTFGAIDCHFNVPGSITMTLSSIHDRNLRLEVSGGGPTQPTWATGNAIISVALFLF